MSREKKQRKAVMQYLAKHGEITSDDAWMHLHISRLAAVICKMRKDGIGIETVKRSVETPYGKTDIAVYRVER